MKKHYLLLLLLGFMFSHISGQDISLKGEWKIEKNAKNKSLSIKHTDGNDEKDWGFTSSLDELSLKGFNEGKGVTFSLINDAGEIVYTGDVGADSGKGTYIFTANMKFVSEIANAGMTDIRPTTLMFFTFQGVKSTYFLQLAEMGFSKQLKDKGTSLVALDISVEYIGKIKSLGFENIQLDQIISFSALGITPEYIAEFKQQFGGDMSVNNITSYKAIGINPQYAAEMKDAGFDLSPQQLVSFKAMGISPRYLGEMNKVGIAIEDPEQIIMLKAQGVDAKFIEEYKAQGFTDMNPSSIAKNKIFRITPSFIKEIKDAGYNDISNEKLVEFKIHGINAAFIKQATEFNDGVLPEPRKLIMMKISKRKPK